MSGTTRRDIELLISAKDTSGSNLKQVVTNVDALTAALADQIDAAERGEGSLKDLKAAQLALSQAARDLSSIQGQIDAYNKLSSSSDKLTAAAQKAEENLAAFKSSLSAVGTVTDAQESKMQRLETTVTRASAAVQQNAGAVSAQVAALTRAGISIDGFDAAQESIVSTAKAVGVGLSQVGLVADSYAANIAQVALDEKRALADMTAAEKAFAAENAFKQKIADAAQLVQVSDYTNFWINALDKAEAAEKAFASDNIFQEKIAQAQKLGQAASFVKLFNDALSTGSAGSNQSAALAGFQAVGQKALEAANDMTRFTQAGNTAAATSSQIAAGLRAIIDPAAAARETLAGVEAAIDESATVAASSSKDVQALNQALNDLSSASAALVRQGGLVDSFKQQQAAVTAAEAAYKQAQAEVVQLSTAMTTASVPTAELANDLKTAEAQAMATGKAFVQAQASLAAMDSGMVKAGLDTTDLAATEAKLTAAATKVNASLGQVNKTLGKGGQATGSLFGLQPNDLTNLGYQINDIVVSLASGQNPLTVLVQQGAQIGQIPGVLSKIAGLAVDFAPLIIAFTAIGAAIKTNYDASVRLQQAMQDLAKVANPNVATAQQFADITKSLESAGASAKDANAALVSLANEGFNVDQIKEYSAAAQELVKTTGTTLPEAVQSLITVQSGGMDQVIALAGKTIDLTNADLDYAQQLFDTGQASQARQYILDTIATKQAQIAMDSNTVWTPAIQNFETAWEHFASFLGSVVQPVLSQTHDILQNIAIAAAGASAILAGKGVPGMTDAVAQATAAANKNNAFKGGNAPENFDNDSGSSPKASAGTTPDAQQLADRKALIELQTEYNGKLTDAQKIQAAGLAAARQYATLGASSAVQQQAMTKAEGEAKQQIADADAADAKKAATAQDSAQSQLEGQIKSLKEATDTDVGSSLAEQLDKVDQKYEQIFEDIKKVQALGVTSVGGQSLSDVTAQANASKDRLKTETEISFYQQQATDLSNQQATAVKSIADQQKAGAISGVDAFQQTQAITNKLTPQIIQAAQQALTIAKSFANTNPSPKLMETISQLETLQGGATATSAADQLNQSQAPIDQALKTRDSLTASYNTLGQLGAINGGNAQDLTAQAYSNASKQITPLLTQQQALVTSLHDQGKITDDVYESWEAQIATTNAGLTDNNTVLGVTKKTIANEFAPAVSQAFDTIGQSISGLITGTQTFGDVLQSIATGAVSIFTTLLQDIANALIQMEATKLAEEAISLFHDGGVVGGLGTSKQTRTGMGSWAGAPKFHSGGGVGLQPDEYKAVLQRGEEVLTADDPRHINNLGNGSSNSNAASSIKQVLLLDPNAVPSAMQGSAGQRALLTVIKSNALTIKQLIS